MSTRESLHELDRQLKETMDPWKRLPLLIECCELYADFDPNRSVYLARQALEIATMLNDRYWIARSTMMIGASLIGMDRGEETLGYLLRASELLERLQDAEMLAKNDYYLGCEYCEQGEIKKAYERLLRAQHYFADAGRDCDRSTILIKLSSVYLNIGDHARSLRSIHKALKLADQGDYTYELGSCHLQLGHLYRRIGDVELEEKHLRRGASILRTLDNDRLLAVAMANLSTLNFRMGRNRETVRYASRARRLFHDLEFPSREGMELSKIGAVYSRLGFKARAISMQHRSVDLLEAANKRGYLVYGYKNLALSYHKDSRSAEGLPYLLKALPLVEELDNPHISFQIYEALATLYEDVGDSAKALEYHKLFVASRDQVANAGKLRAFQQEELQRELRLVRKQLNRYRRLAKRESIEREKSEGAAYVLAMRLNRLNGSAEAAEGSDRPESERIAETIDVEADRRGGVSNRLHDQHRQFCERLSHRFPELSPAELDVCGLIRNGHSTKEIAGILNVSYRTVEKHRERIRSKIDLGPRRRLALFIRTLDLS